MRKLWQIIYNTAKSFYEDGCSMRAAALTYYTLMSLVPVLALALGLARGFGFAPILEDVIKDQLVEQPEIAKYIINFAYKLLEETSGGVIAGVGLLVLLWSAYNILGSIEEALNTIWKIPNPRSWVRKITDYISTMVICPLFFVVSSSLNIYFKTHFSDVSARGVFFESILVRLFPYLLTWILFTFLYFFLPNRRIPLKYGIIGVLVAGTAYQLLQAFYITLQLKLSSYGAIYGSFAALPLFLIWLNLSWMIVLMGAELAYQVEIASWDYIPKNKDYTHTITSQRVVALLVVYTIVQAFCEGKEPLSIPQLSKKLGISKKSLDEIIKVLVNYKILSETYYEMDDDIHYQPTQDVNKITMKTVIDVFPEVNQKEIQVYKSPLVEYFEEKVKKYEETVVNEPVNIHLSQPIPVKTIV